jgi:hypothetical protein
MDGYGLIVGLVFGLVLLVAVALLFPRSPLRIGRMERAGRGLDPGAPNVNFAPPGVAPPEDVGFEKASVDDRLTELDELRDKRLITPDEYRTRRRDLTGQRR